MKKVYNFVFIVLISIIFLPSIVNAATLGDPNNCSISNPYYDSDILTAQKGTPNPEQRLVYDIANVYVLENKLYLYGWAFNNNVSTILDGSNAKVDFVLHPSDGGEDIPFDPTTYATSAGASCYADGCGGKGGAPKYYDLSYWNCLRQDNVTINGTLYTTGGYCMEGEAYTATLVGGFRATIDLTDSRIKPNSTYIVKMKYSNSNTSDSVGGWYEVSAAKAVAYDSVFDYEGTDNMKINISGFGETAEVITKYGRPFGSNGLYCSSNISKSDGIEKGKSTYYQKTTGFPIQDERGATQFGCRGGSARCPAGGIGAGSIRLYRLYYTYNSRSNEVKPASSTSGSGVLSDFAPASWLQFGGNITITTSQGEVETPEIPAPVECEGGEIYYFYYFFLAVPSNDFSGRMITSAQGANFDDEAILRNLGFNSNSEIKKNGGIYPVTKDNLTWYYDKLSAAASSSTRWINEGNNYYIAYNSWCLTDDDGNQTTCYDAITGCELDSSGNKTSNCNPNGISTGNFDKQAYAKATVNVDVATDGKDPLIITPQDSKSGLGYQFSVSRFFKAYPNGRPSMLYPGSKATPTSDKNRLFHPALYQLSFCKTEEPQCDDTVNSAECPSGDVGVEFVFNEHDDKKVCTLEHGTHSGFTIIEEEETRNYCTVACKEDLSGVLPGAKETAAGQYFKLDNYVPKISANRTCVTSEIKKYSEFDKELEDAEKTLMSLYNTWQDWIKINGQMDGSGYTIGLSKLDGPKIKDSGDCTETVITGYVNGVAQTTTNVVGSYVTYEWSINASTGPNKASGARGGASYSGSKGTYTEVTDSAGDSCTPSEDKSKETYDTDITTAMVNAEKAYSTALSEYVNNINAYNRCFNWLDPTNDLKIQGRYTVQIKENWKRGDYSYGFQPTVSFNYPDKDGSIFPVSYTYKYNTRDVEKFVPLDVNVYWSEGSTVDNMYDVGGVKTYGSQPRGENLEERTILNCQEDTCDESSTEDSFFYSSSYLRRDERVEYTYHLPNVFTSVPSGKVTTSPGTGTLFLPLESEAVPVNINTFAGIYDYIITITNLKDALRKIKEDNNPDDDWDDRFSQKALNAGDDYVCTYDVYNDIYLPGPKRFNFFYRVVDTYDINPLNRTLGYNWNDGRGDRVQEVIREDALDYQTLTNSSDRDKFQYTLTPVAMQAIRKYNAVQNISDDGYADWDLNCSDYPDGGYHCRSNFLTCLASGGKHNESDQKNCSTIFENSLSNYSRVSDYDLDDLRVNRQLIINKQNALDCANGISEAC